MVRDKRNQFKIFEQSGRNNFNSITFQSNHRSKEDPSNLHNIDSYFTSYSSKVTLCGKLKTDDSQCTGCPKKKYSVLSLNNFKMIEAITLK